MKCKMGFCNNEAMKTRWNKQGYLCTSCMELTKNVRSTTNYTYRLFSATVNKMLSRIKDRNRYKSNLKPDDIYNIWPKDNKCPILKLEFSVGEPRKNSPSLDRIDSTKDYTPDNIQIISDLANKMKQNATNKELLLFSNYYMEMLNGKSSE